MQQRFKTLAESERFIVAGEFENAVVIEKATRVIIDLGVHYGDPRVGAIAQDESWFAAGGDGLTFWHRTRGYHEFLRGTSVIGEDPVVIRYNDPQTGDDETLDNIHRVFEPRVSVRDLEMTPEGELEVIAEDAGERWVLSIERLSLRRVE